MQPVTQALRGRRQQAQAFRAGQASHGPQLRPCSRKTAEQSMGQTAKKTTEQTVGRIVEQTVMGQTVSGVLSCLAPATGW